MRDGVGITEEGVIRQRRKIKGGCLQQQPRAAVIPCWKKKKSQIHRCPVPFSIHEVVEQAKLISIRKKKSKQCFLKGLGEQGQQG